MGRRETEREIGMICELTGIYVPNPKLGVFSVMPSFANGIYPGNKGKGQKPKGKQFASHKAVLLYPT